VRLAASRKRLGPGRPDPLGSAALAECCRENSSTQARLNCRGHCAWSCAWSSWSSKMFSVGRSADSPYRRSATSGRGY